MSTGSKIAALLGAAGVVAAGCGSSHNAAPSPPPPPPPTMAAGDATKLLLSKDELGGIVGTKFNYADKELPGGDTLSDPSPVDQGNPACDAFFGPNNATVRTPYVAYRVQVVQEDDTENYTHSVTQAAIVVADPGAAKQLLSDAFEKPLGPCDGQKIRFKNGELVWTFHKGAVSDTDVRWMAVTAAPDTGQPTTWGCGIEARAKNNVVVFAKVCQDGNGSPSATAVVDKISAKIPG
jgi:PknH-like extracellular domain